MVREYCCITRVYNFSAGHRLYLKNASDEENLRIFGKCTNLKGHGHDYYLEVKITGEIDPETGMITNLDGLDSLIKVVIEELDHKRLDIEIPFFQDVTPSGENILKYLWIKIKPMIRIGNLHYLKLWETRNNYFEYFEEGV